MTKKEFKRKHAAHEYLYLGTMMYRRGEEEQFEANLARKIKEAGGVSGLIGVKTTRCEVDGANYEVSIDQHGLIRILSCYGARNMFVAFYREK